MWLSVAIPAAAEHADALSDALMDAGALSVSVEDAQAGTADETPQFGEPGCPTTPLWEHSRVIALFDARQSLAEVMSAVAASCEGLGLELSADTEVTEVAEQNWVQLTQAQFDPIQINERLWIVPSWHEAPDATAVNLVLDPGMAFGTGSHPTTRLCLEWLSTQPLGGVQLLDYGCGSGILAIAAARLGAGSVMGVDIDEQALSAAAANAATNQVSLRLQHGGEPLAEQFDVVVANILTNPLCVLAPALAAHVRPGGQLILSGILATQVEQVRAAYAPWLALSVGATLDGWVRLEARRAVEEGAA